MVIWVSRMRVQTYLDPQLPHFHQKVPNAVLVLVLVQDDEFRVWVSLRAVTSHILPGTRNAETDQSLMRSRFFR